MKLLVNSVKPKLYKSMVIPNQVLQECSKGVETNSPSRTDEGDTSARVPISIVGIRYSPTLLRKQESEDKELHTNSVLIYGSNKGAVVAGQPVFSSKTGHPGFDNFAAPQVTNESIATADGILQAWSGNLGWTPLVRNTIEFTDGTQIVRDDGNGVLTGDVSGAGTNTINYATGAYNFTFAAVPASGLAVVANYEYDNEANQQIPEIDFQLTSSPVAAQTYKLRTRYSLEAAQNLRSLHNMSAETEVVTGLAQELRFEIDRTIIKDLNNVAQATAVTWPMTPATGISWTEHKLSLVDVFIKASNNIFELTRRGQPNFGVIGLRVSDVVESLPGFKPSNELSGQTGIINAGVLNGRWKIFKDPYNIDGTSSQKNFLVGYKGATFLESGYVYAPYIPFYTTPTVVLDDQICNFGNHEVVCCCEAA
jgi:hypothetical protein